MSITLSISAGESQSGNPIGNELVTANSNYTMICVHGQMQQSASLHDNATHQGIIIISGRTGPNTLITTVMYYDCSSSLSSQLRTSTIIKKSDIVQCQADPAILH